MGRNIFILKSLKSHVNVSFEVKRIYSSAYHEGMQGRWGVTSLILNFNTWWMSVVNLTPHLLYPRGYAPQYHCWGGQIGRRVNLDVLEQRKFSCPCWDSNPGSSSPYPSCYADYTILAPEMYFGGGWSKEAEYCTSSCMATIHDINQLSLVLVLSGLDREEISSFLSVGVTNRMWSLLQLGMYTLSVITEISPDQFLPHVSSLAVLFSNMLNSVQDLSSPLAYYTVLTMIHFVPLAEGDQSVSCISCTICKVDGVHK